MKPLTRFALSLACCGLLLWPLCSGAAFPKQIPRSRPVPAGVPEDAMEYPEDAPLPPARSVPGAPPAPRIQFGNHVSIQVNVDTNGANIPGDAANEPTIAVDPTNPLNIVISWRQFDNVQSNFRQAGHAYSTDEGRTWTFPGVLNPGVFRSDPVLSADADGNFYFNSLHETFTTDVFKSTDKGVTWSTPVYAYGGDKQWMTADRTSGIGRGNLYSFWTQSGNDFTRSLDHGASFRPPSSIPSSPQWGTMDVSPNGVLWLVGIGGFNSSYMVSRSTDAQDPLDLSTSFTTLAIDLGGDINGFGGPNPEGLLGQPWIAIDPSSGPNAGNIYVVGSCDPPGADPLDVHFIRSTDGGTTWSAPVKLNDDPSATAWQWFGTMSVAPNGRIDVVWNDTRHTGQVNRSELFYTRSTDGGLTFSANEQISPVWDSFIGWPNQNKIGDYYQMISDRVGATLAWSATFNGEQDVYCTRIGDYDCNGNGVGDSLDIAQGTSGDSNGNGIPDECEGILTAVSEPPASSSGPASSPNPFHGSTEIRWSRPVGEAPVRISILSAGGQLVRSFPPSAVPAGAGSMKWDGTDDRGRPVPQGLYLVQIEAGGVRTTQRTVLLR